MVFRGTSLVIAAALSCLLSSKANAQISFLQRCFGKPELTQMKLTCEYQGEKMKYPIRLTLQNGEGFLVESGKGGIYKRHLNLTRVQHLPPALTDKGFISNHVRFLATDGASTAVVDIPCGDPSVVLVGLGRPSNEQAIPAQEIGTCSIQ